MDINAPAIVKTLARGFAVNCRALVIMESALHAGRRVRCGGPSMGFANMIAIVRKLPPLQTDFITYARTHASIAGNDSTQIPTRITTTMYTLQRFPPMARCEDTPVGEVQTSGRRYFSLPVKTQPAPGRPSYAARGYMQ